MREREINFYCHWTVQLEQHQNLLFTKIEPIILQDEYFAFPSPFRFLGSKRKIFDRWLVDFLSRDPRKKKQKKFFFYFKFSILSFISLSLLLSPSQPLLTVYYHLPFVPLILSIVLAFGVARLCTWFAYLTIYIIMVHCFILSKRLLLTTKRFSLTRIHCSHFMLLRHLEWRSKHSWVEELCSFLGLDIE